MGLFGGDSSTKSTSSAADNRILVGDTGRGFSGNTRSNFVTDTGRLLSGKNSQYRESGSIDFSRGKLIESGGLDMSGKGNKAMFGGVDMSGKGNKKILQAGSTDLSGLKIASGGNASFNYATTDQGAVQSAFTFASDALARAIDAAKPAPANPAATTVTVDNSGIGGALSGALESMSSAIAAAINGMKESTASQDGGGASISDAVQAGLQGAAQTAADAASAATAPAPWYENKLLLVGAGVGAWWLWKKAK